MLTIILRAIIIYILVLFVYRLMGKRQIGQMQPFELVLTLIIADLATLPMAELSIPVLHGIVPLLTLVVAHYALTLISKASVKFRNLISGKPVIVINPDGVDEKALRSLNITIDDLFEAIRGAGYFNLDEVEYAIMETNGTINVLPKANFAPIVNQDLNIKLKNPSIPVTIVSDGTIMHNNLKLINLDKAFIENIMKKEKIKKLSNIVVMTINNDKVYIKEKNKPYQVLENMRGLNE